MIPKINIIKGYHPKKDIIWFWHGHTKKIAIYDHRSSFNDQIWPKIGQVYKYMIQIICNHRYKVGLNHRFGDGKSSLDSCRVIQICRNLEKKIVSRPLVSYLALTIKIRKNQVSVKNIFKRVRFTFQYVLIDWKWLQEITEIIQVKD